MLTIASWNVNGVRAALEHGMLKWLDEAKPDVLCIQETKAQPDQLPASLLEPRGYRTLWASAARKGYSGVAAFVRAEPVAVTPLGVLEHDCEGRVQILRFPQVTIVNTYFPNSQDAGARLDYKLGFCEALLERCNRLRLTADGFLRPCLLGEREVEVRGALRRGEPIEPLLMKAVTLKPEKHELASNKTHSNRWMAEIGG